MTLQNDLKIKQLRWKCRRGMLEVDLYLIAYLDHAFVTATEADQGAFEDLLEEADPVLLAWLTGAEEPESSVQKNIVLEIQQARKDHRHFT